MLHVTPTGVDRVEMAYARGLLAVATDRLRFAAVHPCGVYGRLPRAVTLNFLDHTEARWEHAGRADAAGLRRAALANLFALRPRPVSRCADGQPRVLVQASPHHLTRPDLIASIRRREQARFICLVHDLIPLEYPEYARPDGAAQHRRRIETIVGQADGIVANSHATLNSLRPWLERAGTAPILAVAHLGTHDHIAPPEPPPAATRPYFVSIGTIEPRKNHLLLLNLWRHMAEEAGASAIPRLVLIGRRGWENEQIVDMLERCPALVGCVEEHSGLSDRDTRNILAGARALLMPSFAEGYGMPVTEALDLGVPVLCSDLPALREAGGSAPLFLDPLDGPAWRRAILAYAAADSPERREQCDRIASWSRPTWKDHIARVGKLIEAVAR
jgi:glycosyltransferase involved in cell wall biosynthesis